MNPSEIPVGLEQWNGINGNDHRLMGSVKTDSVSRGIRGFGDRFFLGTGIFQSMEGLGEPLWIDRFDQIINRLKIERLDCVFRVGGDHNRLGGRVKCFQEIQAGCAWHLDIEKKGVRSFLADEFDGSGFVAGFADDLKIGMGSEKLTKALEGESLVIAEDYTEHGSPFKSRLATTCPLSSVSVKW
jgi:hypothetical protein